MEICWLNRELDEEATIKRRDDLTESKIEKDLVCGIHFHFGNAASLRDKYNPDWLPSLHLGHSKWKRSDQQKKQQERAQRTTEDVNARGNMRNRIKLL